MLYLRQDLRLPNYVSKRSPAIHGAGTLDCNCTSQERVLLLMHYAKPAHGDDCSSLFILAACEELQVASESPPTSVPLFARQCFPPCPFSGVPCRAGGHANWSHKGHRH